jgi:sulfide:quinone oxidoreductase
MPSIKTISDTVSVSGWLNADDFAEAKALGFDKVINFRPDKEVAEQISSLEAEAAAHKVGLAYVQIPVTRSDLFTDEVISRAGKEFATGGHTLAYCASGQRAAIVWAAVSARSLPVDEVLASLQAGGFDLRLIRDDLDAQADRGRWLKDDAEEVIT